MARFSILLIGCALFAVKFNLLILSVVCDIPTDLFVGMLHQHTFDDDTRYRSLYAIRHVCQHAAYICAYRPKLVIRTRWPRELAHKNLTLCSQDSNFFS